MFITYWALTQRMSPDPSSFSLPQNVQSVSRKFMPERMTIIICVLSNPVKNDSLLIYLVFNTEV